MTEWKVPEVICETCKCYEVVNHEQTPYHKNFTEYKKKREIIIETFHKVKLKKIIRQARVLDIVDDEDDADRIENMIVYKFNHLSEQGYDSGAAMESIDFIWALVSELKLINDS